MLLPAQLYKREFKTHKGDYGHVFVVGGSLGLTGAVCLAAQSALRVGAGLVTAGIPESLNNIFEIKLTEVMSLPLPETQNAALSLKAYADINEFAKKIDVIACGCGGARHSSTQKLFQRLVREIDKPLVVDADGINALSQKREVLEKRNTSHVILTPHEGEFSRLTGEDCGVIRKKRKELAKRFALRYNLILVLKGDKTIVTDGQKFFENTTGNPGMATAGSGDVLTGIISGLVAQGMECYKSACLGVYLHGLAGDCAAGDISQACVVASDIIKYLPNAIKLSRRSSIGRAGVL